MTFEIIVFWEHLPCSAKSFHLLGIIEARSLQSPSLGAILQL